MKIRNLILSVCCLALLVGGTGCGKKKVLTGFAQRFAGYVEENERDSILKVYPAAEYAEEFHLDWNPDSLKISKADKPDEFEINYGDGVSMLVKIKDDDKVMVIRSNGLFKYSDSKLKFAERTGALKKNMNDEKLAKVMIQVDAMATELFNDFVKSRKNAIKNMGFTVTYDPQFGMEAGTGYYTLKNTSDEAIGGDEYEITYSGWEHYAGMEKERTWTDIEPGKDIPAHGTVNLPEEFSWHYNRELKAITMHTPSEEAFFKHYQPTGDEYANYVRAHGDEVVKKEALAEGPYTLAGKLGGKYAIHVNLAKGMKYGTYYYDKNGSKNTLDLNVKSFNRRTGELTLEESNNKGEVTGNFVGVLTEDSYTGKMTSFQGKTYDFTLKVVK